MRQHLITLILLYTGVAYVNGYRVEQPSAVRLSVPRPQATELDSNDAVGFSYGNYVLAGYDSATRGLPELNARYKLLSSGNVSLGSARIKAVENAGTKTDAGGKINQALKIYLYDYVDSSTSGNIRDAVALGRGTNDKFTLEGDANQNATGITKLLEANNNDNLFPLSRPRPELVTDITLVTQVEQRSVQLDASKDLVLTQLPAGQSYVDTSLWCVGDADGNLVRTDELTITGTGTRDATIAGGALDNGTLGDAYHVLAYVQKTASVGSKTLGTVESDFTVFDFNPRGVGDPQVKRYIDLRVPDVYDIQRVRLHDSNGDDITSLFTFDNGQRQLLWKRQVIS